MVIEFLVIAVYGVLVVILLFTALAHVRTATPYGATPRAIMDAMIELAAFQGDEVFVDVGAGDGRMLQAVKQAFPGVEAIGYENALAMWMIGRVRLWISRTKGKFLLRDARRDDLSRADVVFLYLGPTMMGSLQEKFDRELRPGTRVLSHCFRFPDRVPLQEILVPCGYGKKKVLVYQW
jgi:hypothetical protein